MFKKMETVSPSISRRAAKTGSYAAIYKGKKTEAFNLNVSKECMTRAKIVVGDRASLHLAEDSKGLKWLVLETDPDGYMLVAAISNAKGLSEQKKGTYDRAVWKTTYLDNFIGKYFPDKRFEWGDDEVQTQTGSIAFPLEKKKTWF